MNINDKVYLFNKDGKLRDEGIIVAKNIIDNYTNKRCFQVKLDNHKYAELYYEDIEENTNRYYNVGNKYFYIVKKYN